jgi:hypothetical protein
MIKARENYLRKAFSLTEVMVAAVVLVIMVIGTAGYRYYTILDSRRAVMQTTAAGVCQLLGESWRGAKGSDTFAPVAQFASAMSIVEKTAGPPPPGGFTLLGKYEVVMNGFNYYATLSWKDDDSGLRILSVTAAWPRSGGQIEYTESPSSNADEFNSFDLTMYVVK